MRLFYWTIEMQLTTIQQQTMTSREIAELVESRHFDVRRAIERLMESEAISRYAAVPYTHPQNGQTYSEYHIGQRDSYVIVAQLSPQFTARLVDRWQELESQKNFRVPTTLSGALRLAAEQAEVIEKQAEQLALAAPAVEFVGRYVESETGSMGFREVCKLLKAKEFDFKAFLISSEIMYRLAGRLTPYQNHLDAGRFEVKTGSANEHAFVQAKFTAKGVKWVAGEWAKYQLEVA